MKTSRNIVLANDKGMSGKSLLAASIALEALKRGLSINAIEIESTPRMSVLYPSIFKHQPINPTEVQIAAARSTELVLGWYDNLMTALQAGGWILDTGSNVTKTMVERVSASGVTHYLGRGANVAFVVPATANKDSLTEALYIIKQISATLPESPIFLVENCKDGPLPTDGIWTEGTRLPQTRVLKLDACASEHWRLIEAGQLNELAALDVEKLIELGLTPAQATRGARAILAFLTDLFGVAGTVTDWLSEGAVQQRKKSA